MAARGGRRPGHRPPGRERESRATPAAGHPPLGFRRAPAGVRLPPVRAGQGGEAQVVETGQLS
ncbi:MAG: hypothetical protein MZV65_00140 [Chromatiales bacterium]|nr:hypothetical protein [Chromatiales bacterium]